MTLQPGARPTDCETLVIGFHFNHLFWIPKNDRKSIYTDTDNDTIRTPHSKKLSQIEEKDERKINI